MARLQYIGQSHYRTISAKDLRYLGFADAEKIDLVREDIEPRYNPKNLGSVAEVSQEVADFLVEREPKEWQILAEDELPVKDSSPGSLKVAPDGGLPGDVVDADADQGAPTDQGSAGKPAKASARTR